VSRKRDSVKARRICFDARRTQDHLGRTILICHLNGCRIDPGRDAWRADHIRRFAEDGEETAENLWPICKRCDAEEKAPNDTREVAKGKRVRDFHYGIKRPKGFRRPAGAKFDWSRGRYVREEAS
jgi:hypothetical protein